MRKPFKAYSGGEPFVFVSYAHSDDELVYPELEKLNLLGFNVWYDEGIQAGQDWTDQLAQRLSECAAVVYFVTPNSVLSRHCANEVHYALDLEKPMLIVQLRPAVLPPGQRMQLGSIQALIRSELTDSEYQTKLRGALSELMADSVAATTSGAPQLPMGMVTLLRLDIVAAHELALKIGDQFNDVLKTLRGLVGDLTRKNGGYEVEMRSDICMMAFTLARQAVQAAVDIQSACAVTSWPQAAMVQVRIGLHAGEPKLIDNQYFGVDVQRVVQIAAIANGGQILLSAETRKQVPDSALPSHVEVRELGTHRLRDMPFPELLNDLVVPGLPSEFSPVASLTNRPTNLPKALPSFVGRLRELEKICSIMEQDSTRILTLTGPGGTGKTRLSIEAARKLEPEFPDGVFMVRLAAITDPKLVIPAIAQTLGIKELAGQTPLQSLTHRLANSRLLLVVDNFEQVVDAANDLLELVQSASRVKIIVSSREALDLRVEKEFPVEPLQLPEPDPMRRTAPLEEVESIQLFLLRVREHKPEFQMTPDNADDIAAICVKVDGLPLALELAAARLSILSPRALRDNLERTLVVLKARSRDLPDRQRTLRSTVEWSYELLDPEERSLFRQLAVFRGGFSLTSAQVVLDGEHDEFELMDGIDSLVRKSLLKVNPDQIEPRFIMLETIRDFAQHLLKEGQEAPAMQSKHAEHFLESAESLAPGLIGRQHRVCVTRMLADADNTRAAMKWFLDQGQADELTRLFRSMWWLWIPRGSFTEGREWVARALERFAELESCREKALIHETAAWVDALAGDYAAAVPNLEICHAIYQQTRSAPDIARTRLSLGITRAVLQIPGGRELSQQALDTFRELDDRYYLALSLVSIGITCLVSEDIPGAADAWTEALQIFREIGNSYWPGQMLINLAHFALQAGEWQNAVTMVMEAMDLAQEYDYPMITNLSVLAMGGVGVQRGYFDEAAMLFGALRASLDRLGVTLEPLENVYLEHYVNACREKLGDLAFDEAYHLGMRMNEKEILAATRAAGE